jgi:NTE family protein
MRIHRIASEMLTELGASSKVNAEWEFFSLLRDEGRKSAQVFLETHASDLGRRSTLDIDVLLGQDLTNGTVAPATDLAGRHVHAA